MTTMSFAEARRIARNIEVEQISPFTWPQQRDRVSTAFHTLDMSDPTTIELRREDKRLARIIWREVGNSVGISPARFLA